MISFFFVVVLFLSFVMAGFAYFGIKRKTSGGLWLFFSCVHLVFIRLFWALHVHLSTPCAQGCCTWFHPFWRLFIYNILPFQKFKKTCDRKFLVRTSRGKKKWLFLKNNIFQTCSLLFFIWLILKALYSYLFLFRYENVSCEYVHCETSNSFIVRNSALSDILCSGEESIKFEICEECVQNIWTKIFLV